MQARKPIPKQPDVAESSRTGELAILAGIRRRAATFAASPAASPFTRSRVRLGIGDDCALLRLRPGEEMAVTTDLSIEGRHFRLDWHPAESVGHRTLARGLSDLAAMGARPVAAFLSLGLPRELALPGVAHRADSQAASSWLDRFLDGFFALAAQHSVALAGGDLAQSPLALADITLTGAVPQREALLRSGARPGDRIYVTGSLGGASAELAALSRSPAQFAGHTSATGAPSRNGSPHLYPRPRLAQGLWLRRHAAASAAIDLSDGLSTDLAHLCQESGVSAEIDPRLLPLGPGATLDLALHGGEDYELLFTVRRATRLPRALAGVVLTQIGSIVQTEPGRPRVTLRGQHGTEPLQAGGWQHFTGGL